jgi:integrase
MSPHRCQVWWKCWLKILLPRRLLGEISYPNPLAKVKQIRIQEQEMSWLTDQQITEILNAVRDRRPGENPHLEPLIRICLATGARWSEAENLKPVSLVNNVVTFSNTKSGKAPFGAGIA